MRVYTVYFIYMTVFNVWFHKRWLDARSAEWDDERNKVIYSNSNERSHILVLHAVFPYRPLLQRWYDYVLNAEENTVSFPKHYSGLHLKEEIKKKRLNLKLETSNMKQNIDLIRRSVCLFTWLESWRGGRSVRWATKLAVPWSHFNILLDKQKK